MSDFQMRQGWVGIDNRANEKRVPEGFVRDMVNLDPLVGGALGMRSGFEKIASATAARGLLSVRNRLVFVDGDQLISIDANTGTGGAIATVDGAGRVVGDVMNEELFLCTETQRLRYDGSTLRRWGVPTVTAQPVPTILAGGLAPGAYQVAVTYLDSHGDEGATTSPLIVPLSNPGALAFVGLSAPDGGKVRLYVGPNQGATLYLQFEGTGDFIVGNLRDDTARLDLINLREPPVADRIQARHGVLYCAVGNVLWFTLPMRPHLMDAKKGFFQYPTDVDVLASVPGGVYVCADRTYFLSNTETGDVQQAVKLEHGAVAGTQTTLPDGRVAWMTQYGMAIGDWTGDVRLVSMEHFVPELAGQGASGMVESNGNQMVVTTLSPTGAGNPLAANDYYDGEIVTP